MIERFPRRREEGQNVDIRGAAREVIRRMGIESDVRAAGTGEIGTRFVTADGRPAASFPVGEPGGSDGPTAELEILRGDLARLLHGAARDHATCRFGDHITGLGQDAAGARVRFASGRCETYDLVVVAEGVGSSTRDLVFPGENRPRWMDLTIAYFTIPRRADDGWLWRWYNAPGGRSLGLRPDRNGTTRASLALQQKPGGEQDWDSARQQAYLRARFADAGWQAARILDGMARSGDFHFDVVRQVRLPRWSAGRVVLTGDAAWCATPLSGIGTTLALTGALVLAGELRRQPGPAAAFAAYEAAMRPMVRDGQSVPKLAPRLMHPRSRLGIRLLHGALALASRPAIRELAVRLSSRLPAAPDLSGYA